MPVSGLVLTLEPGSLSRVVGVLDKDPRVTLGTAIQNRLPLSVETRSLEEGEDVVTDLLGTRGVVFVDVVTLDFEDDPTVNAMEYLDETS